MRVEVLSAERLREFKSFYLRHMGAKINGAFSLQVDVKDFSPDPNNPTYVVIDEDDRLVAAASLAIRDHGTEGTTTSFRFFHSEICDPKCYELLIKAILSPELIV